MRRFVPTALVAGLCLAPIGSADLAWAKDAPKSMPKHVHCIRAGGWGTGVMQGFASFMAKAAMKNSAKSWGGDDVRITQVSETCQWKTLAYECTAHARACKQ